MSACSSAAGHGDFANEVTPASIVRGELAAIAELQGIDLAGDLRLEGLQSPP